MDSSTNVAQEETLESVFYKHRESWTERVKTLNEKLKNIPDVVELSNVIYSTRQDCVTYYYDLMHKLSVYGKDYKKKYAESYNYFKANSNIRYQSDSAINSQIDSALADVKYIYDTISNQCKFMLDTIKTIDGIIFAISNRIKLEELINNGKF